MKIDDSDEFVTDTFQLKIQLNNVKNPPVWRRIKVPSGFSFYELHEIIQLAFGWTNSHLFMFSPGGFGTSPVITNTEYEEDYDEQSKWLDAGSVLLSDIFEEEKQHLTYTYDYGDNWDHRITLEKIIRKASFYPVCIDGKGKCPPEDCGGIWGYENLKEIMADKNHPEYRETAKWLGLKKNEDWNPSEFDISETQILLDEAFSDDEQ